MKKRMTEMQLCAKYCNENAHTEHVAYLALKLFDGMSSFHGLTSSDRRMLESACQLHDMGYMISPCKHAIVSHRIIRKEGIAGLTDEQNEIVAAAVLLHPKKYEKLLGLVRLKKGPDREKAFRIASLLRIADALDHSHLQDVDVSSVTLVKGTVMIKLAGVRCAGIIGWAYEKSDLFRKTYSRHIHFADAAVRGAITSPYTDLIDGRDSVLKGARSVISYLFRSFSDHKKGVIKDADIEHLHEMRVLVRRFVVAMKCFSPYWKSKAAKRLLKKARLLCDKLGERRDMDVWMDFLSRKEVLKIARSSGDWIDFYANQEKAREAAHDEVSSLLESGLYSELVQQVGYFIRVVIPRIMLEVPDDRYRDFTVGQVRRMYTGLTRKRHNFSRMSAKKMHDFRKELRKMRYAVEFTVPVADAGFLQLEKALSGLTGILGGMHDLEVHKSRITACKNAPKGLLKYISARNGASLKKFSRKWEEFRKMKKVFLR